MGLDVHLTGSRVVIIILSLESQSYVRSDLLFNVPVE